MQSTTEISQKGLNDMKNWTLWRLLFWPPPIRYWSALKEDGSTNWLPLLCVLPPSIRLWWFRHWQTVPHRQACGDRQSHCHCSLWESGRRSNGLQASTGAETDKVAANKWMMAVDGSDIRFRWILVWRWWPPCSSRWKLATISCTSVRWTSSWAMRTRRGCMPGTASESCTCGRRLNLKTARRHQRWPFVLNWVVVIGTETGHRRAKPYRNRNGCGTWHIRPMSLASLYLWRKICFLSWERHRWYKNFPSFLPGIGEQKTWQK